MLVESDLYFVFRMTPRGHRSPPVLTPGQSTWLLVCVLAKLTKSKPANRQHLEIRVLSLLQPLFRCRGKEFTPNGLGFCLYASSVVWGPRDFLTPFLRVCEIKTVFRTILRWYLHPCSLPHAMSSHNQQTQKQV